MGMHDPFYPVTVDGVKPTRILNRLWQVAELGFLAWLVISRAFIVLPNQEDSLGISLIYAHPAWWTWPVIFLVFSLACSIGSFLLRWLCRWMVAFIYGSEDPAVIEEVYNRRRERKAAGRRRRIIRAEDAEYEEVKKEDMQLPEGFANLKPTYHRGADGKR